MTKSIEITGKTEEEAIASALQQLGKSREEVSVEIIERAKSGFLGLGASPAVIRVSYEAEDDQKAKVERFLRGLLEHMGAQAEIEITERGNDGLNVTLSGSGMGAIIGRRGETLDALQYLTSLQVNKGREGYIRVTLDTENYRAKREDSLRRLAQRMANRAQKTGRKVVLEPMNPYERRVLHTALQNHPAVTTHSEGEEPNRRVVIMLAGQSEKTERAEKGERSEKSEKSGSSRRSRSRRRGRGRGPKSEGANNAAETATTVSENTGAEE